MQSRSWIADKVVKEGGRAGFDRFMEWALYDPEHGYYTRNISNVGTSGDFSTGATIGEALIESVANWIKAEQHDLGPLGIIELGGGSGALAAGILRRFAFWKRADYQVIEISSPLREIQRYALRNRRILWQDSLRKALNRNSGRAIVISNEFVDSFPCRRFVKTEAGWAEMLLEYEEDVWREMLVESKELPKSSSFDPSLPLGQRLEIHDSYHRWLAHVSAHFSVGSLLTIDYGGPASEIYDRKPNGTLRGFFRHQRIEGKEIYLRPGQQDLTADVNFTDLQSWGTQLGFKTISYGTQSEFIGKWDRRPTRRSDGATPYLTDRAGMGTAFKVLHQRRIAR
jgi:SAM-dependent MidA family methyltransferase